MSFTCPDYPAVCFLFQLSEFSHSSSVSSWFTLVFLFSFLPLFVFLPSVDSFLTLNLCKRDLLLAESALFFMVLDNVIMCSLM